MPSPERLGEAERQLRVCNACRYCEGYCAVFPAMERRQSFEDGDLVYLANLCFECRACYYACPFTAPHEFAINLPQAFSRLRVETYRHYAWPRIPSRLERLAVPVLAGACAVIVPLLALALRGTSVLLSGHSGEGAFYAVVPYDAMVLPALVLMLFGLASLTAGVLLYWRDTHGRFRDLLDVRAHARAARAALALEYLKGGGAGCSYPDSRPSHVRRWLHHLMFYGFGLALAATIVASGYHNLLGRVAPYPLWSWPVVLGSVGGIAMSVGSGSLLALKRRSDPAAADAQMVETDVVFLVLLLWTNLTGLALLALRDTPAMGTLLVVHLGAVAGLFLTLPYGKLSHAAYRYAALVQNALEQSGQAPRSD